MSQKNETHSLDFFMVILLNVSGCAFLLSSNYLLQQQDGCIHGNHGTEGDCGHNRDHNHDHDGGSCDH